MKTISGLTRRFAVAIGVVSSLFIYSCGGGSSNLSTVTINDSGSSSSGTTNTPAVGGAVSTVTISNGTNIDLTSASGDMMLMLYSYSTSSSSSSFQLSSENEAAASTNFLMSLSQGEMMDESDETEDFHAHLRALESDLVDEPLRDGEGASRYLVRYATEGSQQTFKVLNSFSSGSSYTTVTATLILQTEYFNFYMDNRNLGSVSSSNLQSLANDFANVIDLERDLFGTESDVNGDGRFDVLFTQTVNQLGGSSGGMVTGFFYAVDLFDSNVYSISNEREVFYTFVPDPNGSYGAAVSESFAMSNIYRGVLAHEYQHMISFNMHYNQNGGSSEEAWLNEGLSHLAEDIYSADETGYMTRTGLENPARVSGYLSRVSTLCFTCGSSLYQRGGSYLFARYLYEQAELGAFENLTDGRDFLNRVLDTRERGEQNIVNAVFGSGSEESEFSHLLGLFGLAMYLSDTGLTDDSRFSFSGINLRGSQNDNRGTYLSGPATQTLTGFPYSSTVSGNGFVYMNIDGETSVENGRSLSISTSTGSQYGGYLIQE